MDKGFFVDYLSFTIKVETTKPTIAASYLYKYVNIDIEDAEHKVGMLGYKQGLYFPSGIKVMFDGFNQDDAMGIHIIIPGSAFDNSHVDFNIFELIDKLKNNKYHFNEHTGKLELKETPVMYNITRLDIAKDTNEIEFSYFYNKYKKKEFSCKYQMKDCRENTNALEQGTLYFGKRGGMTMFRVYDKAHQQGLENTIWTRVELELRGNNACEQAIEALKNGTINNYFEGHLRFVNKRVDNMSRAKTTDIYSNFLNNPTAKMKFTKKQGDETLEWCKKAVFPTLKALIRDFGIEYVLREIDKSKISKKQFKKRFGLHVVKGKNYVTNQDGDIKDKGYLMVSDSGEIHEDKYQLNEKTGKLELKDIAMLRELLKGQYEFSDDYKKTCKILETDELSIEWINLLNLSGETLDVDIDANQKYYEDGRKIIKAEQIKLEMETLFGKKQAI